MKLRLLVLELLRQRKGKQELGVIQEQGNQFKSAASVVPSFKAGKALKDALN